MIIITKKDKYGRSIRSIGNFSADAWNFKNVKKTYLHRGYRGSPSTYKFTAKAYWKESGKYAGDFTMSAKNLKDLKEKIVLENDWVHVQLKRNKERIR